MTAGSDAEPDWPPLTEHEVRVVLAMAGIAGPATIEWRSPRPFSAAALVRSGDHAVVVKRHDRRVRDPDQLATEHAFLERLRAGGVPVPEVLGPIVELAESSFELFGVLRGHDVYRDAWSWTPYRRPSHARAAGLALARLHQASSGYAAPRRAPAPLLASTTVVDAADPLAAVESLAGRLPALAAFLAGKPSWRGEVGEALAPFHARWRARAGDLEPLWTHGDWHPSNLFWSGAGEDAEVTGVFDVGLCNMTTACYDLATAIERSCIGWLEPASWRPVFAEHVDALVAGYESARPLAAGEREALADLLPLAHVDYALSEIEYFHGIVGSARNAGLAYHDYLLGHLRWFASAPGRELCARVATRC